MIRFLFFILFMTSCLRGNEQNDFTQVLGYFKSISAEEQQAIRLFFKELFFEQASSYSLFGNKPMSLSRKTLNEYSTNELLKLIRIDQCCQSLLEPYSDPSHCLKKQWEIWQKHESNFKMKNYCLVKKKMGGQIHLIFINKKAFKAIVDNNINLFRSIIHSDLSSDMLLEDMKNENKDLLDILHHNEGLLGILLGFGTHNAMLFQKREELLQILGKNLQNPERIQDQIRVLDHQLQSLHEHDPFIIATMNRVGFAADPHHIETIKLRNQYDRLTRIINKIYSKEDWFEQTLIQLSSDSN